MTREDKAHELTMFILDQTADIKDPNTLAATVKMFMERYVNIRDMVLDRVKD